jgi:transglutaminase-like putative cysteine protease
VKKSLPGGISDEVKQNKVVQEFDISALDSIWLPVAYRPTKVEGVKHASYNAALGSLISSEATSNGLQYKVESEIPEFSPDALRTAEAVSPDLQFLELPAISSAVSNEAKRVTAGATTAYDKALALQNYFRTGFAYTLDIPRAAHDERAMERFLFRDKKGYCEQFAGTYAVMARAIGLPTRVAVGFTPGETFADGRFHVRGLNAHAWPEVYMGQFGWVAFEPTPGRGRPGAQSYTGVQEAQATESTPGASTTLTTATPTTVAPGSETATTRRRGEEEVDAGGGSTGLGKKASPWVKPAVGVGLVLVIWLLGVPLLLARRRARRRALAADGVQRVVVSWQEAAEALGFASVGAARRPAETVHEYAARAPGAAGFTAGSPVHTAMRDLAGLTAVASYSPEAVGAETVARAIGAAEVVRQEVARSVGWRKRLKGRIDPRPLLPRRTREITGRAGSKRAA